MPSTILYRLPQQAVVHELHSTSAPLALPHYTAIGQQRGYVFAPFTPTDDSPILLLVPEAEQQWMLPKTFLARHVEHSTDERRNRAQYADEFQQCLRLLHEDKLQKIVLSRPLQLQLDTQLCDDDLRNLFIAACHRYPQSFVSLIHTPLTGTWLIATPEVLIEEREAYLHTMALAATMPTDEGALLAPTAWSATHQTEQRLVSDYIAQQLRALNIAHYPSDLQVKRSGKLLHLCTQFSIPLPLPCSLGQLVSALHPTPAVCGLPTAAALQALAQIEQHDRSYYAGFSGPIDLEGGTHLFVTLRCLRLSPSRTAATLFAGGGLLAESQENAEWVETCRKLQTMLSLLQ